MIHLELIRTKLEGERVRLVFFASINNRLSSRHTVNMSLHSHSLLRALIWRRRRRSTVSGSGCVLEADTKSAVCRDRAVQSQFLTKDNQDGDFFSSVTIIWVFAFLNLGLLSLRKWAFPQKKHACIWKNKRQQQQKKNLHDSYSHTQEIHSFVVGVGLACKTQHSFSSQASSRKIHKEEWSVWQRKVACDDCLTKCGVDLNECRFWQRGHANSRVWVSCNYDNIVTGIIWLIRSWT